MASFDYFSQPQGPVVPISLFGDAATAGINAGNALPTKLTAAIQGGIKGYQQGQQIEATAQQNTLRANEIEQIPVQNEIRQQQLENVKLRNQADTLQLDIQTQTHGAELEATNAKLEDDVVKLNQDRQVRQAADQFTNTFKSADPQQQAQMVLGGQYSDVFAKDPNLYKQSLQSIYLNPKSNLDPATKANIGAFFRKGDIKDAYTKAAEANLGKYQAAEAELLNDSLTGQVVQNTGLSARQAYSNSKFVDSTEYQLAPDGKTVLIDPKTNAPARKPEYAPMGQPPISFDVMYKNPQNGNYEIVAKGVDKDQKKKFDIWIAQKAIQDGSSMRSDIAQVDQQNQETQNQIKKSIPGRNIIPSNVNTFSTTQPGSDITTQQPKRIQIAQQTLGLSEAAAIHLDPTLKSLEDHLVQERIDPEYRSSPAAALNRNALFETIGRSYADTQYENSPAIQAQYTPATVKEYNKSIETNAYLATEGYGGDQAYFSGVSRNDRIKQLIGPFLADSPKDYYYKKNLVAINQSLKYLSNQYSQLADDRVKAKVNKITNTQRIMQDLAGVAGG